MKSQVHNQGELKELNVKIEKEVIESFERMTKTSGLSLAEMVVIAMKRYRSSHSDWDVKSKKSE
jgi:fructose-1,6-bisphosphatase/sedoheptulose 1,7-bisphosphatase-like protein